MAWPCERDAPAPVAASKIHTDFEKHFIRAEVTSVDELVAAGSMDALRAAGKLRVEGRDYRVKDGDVVFFRIGRCSSCARRPVFPESLHGPAEVQWHSCMGARRGLGGGAWPQRLPPGPDGG